MKKVIILLGCVVAILVSFYGYKKDKACRDKGGVYLRDKCVAVEEIK